jgi:hypothetical protein
MSEEDEVVVLAADRLGGAVVITFANGTTAEYSAALLWSVLERAKLVDESVEYIRPGT